MASGDGACFSSRVRFGVPGLPKLVVVLSQVTDFSELFSVWWGETCTCEKPCAQRDVGLGGRLGPKDFSGLTLSVQWSLAWVPALPRQMFSAFSFLYSCFPKFLENGLERWLSP